MRPILTRDQIETVTTVLPPLIYSLGGCVIYESCKRMRADIANYVDHFWRRPTIALMSRPSAIDADMSMVPELYQGYLSRDISKQHWQEVMSLPEDAVLVLDITRDVFTGVVEIEPGAFVMNPAEAVMIIEGLEDDSMTDQVVDRIFGKTLPRLSARSDTDAFLKVWADHVDRMIETLKDRFAKIVLFEIYFTDTVAFVPLRTDLFPEVAERANVVLERMYDHLRRNPSVQFITIDRHRLVSGTDVAWDGPTHTHFLDETYALYADRLEALLRGSPHSTGEQITDTAFARACENEVNKAALREAREQAEVLKKQLDGLAEAQQGQALDAAHQRKRARKLKRALVELSTTEAHLQTALQDAARSIRYLSDQNDLLTTRLKAANETANRSLVEHMRHKMARATRAIRLIDQQ